MQPVVGFEGFPLLDAELPKHGEVERVPLVDDLVLVDVVKPNPVIEATGLITGPGPTIG